MAEWPRSWFCCTRRRNIPVELFNIIFVLACYQWSATSHRRPLRPSRGRNTAKKTDSVSFSLETVSGVEKLVPVQATKRSSPYPMSLGYCVDGPSLQFLESIWYDLERGFSASFRIIHFYAPMRRRTFKSITTSCQAVHGGWKIKRAHAIGCFEEVSRGIVTAKAKILKSRQRSADFEAQQSSSSCLLKVCNFKSAGYRAKQR